MSQASLPLPGLSPVEGRRVEAIFSDDGTSSDAGALILAEIARKTGILERLGRCLDDRRDSARIDHGLAEMIGFRALMIAMGYEDADDATLLRRDPAFKMALGRLPSGAALASQPTLSRLENSVGLKAHLRLAEAMVDIWCASFSRVPDHIVLDIDDTFDACHGGQQLSLFNAHEDGYGFKPIVVFDQHGRLVAAVLRPARPPSGQEVARLLRRLVRLIRARWPRTRILIRGDSHYCSAEAIAECRRHGIDFLFGLAPNARLTALVADDEQRLLARVEAGSERRRRFKTLSYGARSWAGPERVIARIEITGGAINTRFVVTSLTGGRGKWLYERLYCARGQAENHIKAFKTHLKADRTSCHRALANQMRLVLTGLAYWLMTWLRGLAPRRSPWARRQFDTLRLRLLKLGARVAEKPTKITLHLPAACPDQAILALISGRIDSLVAARPG